MSRFEITLKPKRILEVTLQPARGAVLTLKSPSSMLSAEMQAAVLLSGGAGVGNGVDVSHIANAALSGGAVVRGVSGGKVNVASPAQPEAIVGITKGAAIANAPVLIRVSGEMTEPAWAWTPGPIWLSANGQLTQIPPSSGASVEVARAITATRIIVSIQPPIYL